MINSETTEPFALRFELDAMLRLGNSLQDVLFSYAWDGLTYSVMSRTMLGALYAGLWPLGLIKLAGVLDNPFSVALARADKAGKVLAHALIDGVQGKRPVTLMGYSVGARVIYACLLELAAQHAFGLVESVVLMGAPAPSDSNRWRQIRSVVAARVVNVYSTEDYVLGYLYRSTKLEFGVAGLDTVKGVHGIENVDMSQLVSGHDKYRYLAGKILVKIGFGDVDFNKVAEQERALELAEQKKQRAKEQAKRDASEVRAEEIFVQPTSNPASPSLIDIFDEPTPPQIHASLPASRPRPTMYTQSKSKQQPARQMPSRPAPERKPSSSVRMPIKAPALATAPVSAPTKTSDPLGATDLIDTAPATTRQPSRPMASAMKPRQMPSAQISDPAAKDEPLKTPAPIQDKGDGTIQLIDSTQPVASSKEGKDMLKTAPAVTVAEVAVVEGDRESEIDFCEDESDETGSELGELMMVEPVPLDDFDYGLM